MTLPIASAPAAIPFQWSTAVDFEFIFDWFTEVPPPSISCPNLAAVDTTGFQAQLIVYDPTNPSSVYFRGLSTGESPVITLQYQSINNRMQILVPNTTIAGLNFTNAVYQLWITTGEGSEPILLSSSTVTRTIGAPLS